MAHEPATLPEASPRVSRSLAVAVVALAAVTALATTEGKVAVPPSAAGLAGLAAVVLALAALAASPEGRGTAPAVAVALVGLGLVGAQDYLRPGLTMGHDTHHHLWGLWAVWRTVLDGDWTPRWIPYLGTGMPLLQLYSPLSFVLAAPAQATGASPFGALAWLMVLGQVGSAGSAYAAARWLGAERAGGLVAAAAAVLAPYHLLDQTVRCALAESLAFAVLPGFLAAGWKVLAEGGRGAWWALAWISPVLLLVHPLSLITGGIALALLAPFALWRGPAPGRRLARFLAAGALGAALSAGWWLPLAFDLPATGVPAMRADSRPLTETAAGLLEPLERRQWRELGLRGSWSETDDPGAGLPLYFGGLWVALLALAVLRPRVAAGAEPTGGDPWPWGLVGFGLLLLASRAMAPALAAVPGLAILQFPWRLYAPAAVIAALAGGLTVSWWLRHAAFAGSTRPSWRVGAVGLLLALMAADAAPYLGSPGRVPDYRGVVRRLGSELVPVDLPRNRFLRVEEAWLPPADYDWRVAKTRRVFAEYLPGELWRGYGSQWHLPESERALSEILHVSYRFVPGREPLRLDPLPYASLRPEGADQAARPMALPWQRVQERVRVVLPPGHPPGVVWIAESHLPGWQVRLDGGPWGEPLAGGALLAVAVTPRVRAVTFHYTFARPWYRAVGYALSLVSGLYCLLFATRRLPGDV